MISPKIEEARIKFALHNCREKGFEVLDAKELIKKAFDEYGDGLAVSCSFGRCSVAVLHMAREFEPQVKVIFDNTTVLYPQDYEYRDRLVKEWDLNLIETKPIKPFWKVIKEYGLPTIRRQYYHSKRRHTFQEKTGKPACCWFCKDKPFLNACKEYGIKATLTGLRVAESRTRMYYAADYGQYHFTKRQRMMKYNPIMFWTREDLDRYLTEHNIPISEVYTKLGLERNGCMPCTGFLNWEQQLARVNPKMYRYVQKLRGVSLISDFLEMENEVVDGCTRESRQAVLEDWF